MPVFILRLAGAGNPASLWLSWSRSDFAFRVEGKPWAPPFGKTQKQGKAAVLIQYGGLLSAIPRALRAALWSV